MAAHTHDHSSVTEQVVVPADKAKIKKIWMTTLYLGVATGFEFLFAFALDSGFLKTSIFVLLTFLKTFYIVGEFMHLKYEVKTLIWSIAMPVLFICWLILSMLMEGTSVEHLRTWVHLWF